MEEREPQSNSIALQELAAAKSRGVDPLLFTAFVFALRCSNILLLGTLGAWQVCGRRPWKT